MERLLRILVREEIDIYKTLEEMGELRIDLYFVDLKILCAQIAEDKKKKAFLDIEGREWKDFKVR